MKVSKIPRTTLGFLVAIALLGGVYVVQETGTTRRNTIPIPELAAEVDRIVMERESPEGNGVDRLELYRESEEWRVRAGSAGEDVDSPGDSYRADGSTVETLLRDVEELSQVDIISTRANYEEYGLAGGESRRLRLFVGETQPLAIEFGGTAAAGDAVYGRINGSREVALLPRSLASAVATDPDELRDTAVLRAPEEQVAQIEIHSSIHETLTLSRGRTGDSATAAADEGEPVWNIEPEEQQESIDPGRVRDLFSELNPLRAQEFLAEEPDGAPFAEIVVRLSGSRSAEEIRIWPPDGDRRYPVNVSSAEEAVLIPEWRARRLLLGLERYFVPFTESETD